MPSSGGQTVNSKAAEDNLPSGSGREFVAGLDLPAHERERLLAMKPRDYIGLAADLARQV